VVEVCDCPEWDPDDDTLNPALQWIHLCFEDDGITPRLRPRIELGPTAGDDKLFVDFRQPINVNASAIHMTVNLGRMVGLENIQFVDIVEGTSTRLEADVVWGDQLFIRANAINPSTEKERIELTLSGLFAAGLSTPFTVTYETEGGAIQDTIRIVFGFDTAPGLYVVWVETLDEPMLATTNTVTSRSRAPFTAPVGQNIWDHSEMAITDGVTRRTDARISATPETFAAIPAANRWLYSLTGGNDPEELEELDEPVWYAPEGDNRVYVRFSLPVRPGVHGSIQVTEHLHTTVTPFGEMAASAPMPRPIPTGTIQQRTARAELLDCQCTRLALTDPLNWAYLVEVLGYRCTWYIVLEEDLRHGGTYAVDVMGFISPDPIDFRINYPTPSFPDAPDEYVMLYEDEDDPVFRHWFVGWSPDPEDPEEPFLYVDHIWVSTTPDFFDDYLRGRANLIYSRDPREQVHHVDEILTLLNDIFADDEELMNMVANNYLTVIFNRPVLPGGVAGTIGLNWENIVYTDNERWFPVPWSAWDAIRNDHTVCLHPTCTGAVDCSTLDEWEIPEGYFELTPNILETGSTLPGIWDGADIFPWIVVSGLDLEHDETSTAFDHTWFGFNAVQFDLTLFNYNNRATTGLPGATPTVTTAPFNAAPHNIDAVTLRDRVGVATMGTPTVVLPDQLRFTHRPYGLNQLTNFRNMTTGINTAPAATPAVLAEPNFDFLRVDVIGYICAEWWENNHEDYEREGEGFFVADVDDGQFRIARVERFWFGVENDPIPYVLAWAVFDGDLDDFMDPVTGLLDPEAIRDALPVAEFILPARTTIAGTPNIAALVDLAGFDPGDNLTIVMWFSEVVNPSAHSVITGQPGGAGTIGVAGQGNALGINSAALLAQQGWFHQWYLDNESNRCGITTGTGVGQVLTGPITGRDARFPVSVFAFEMEVTAPMLVGTFENPTDVQLNVVMYPEVVMFGVGALRPWHGSISAQNQFNPFAGGREMQASFLHFTIVNSVLDPEVLIDIVMSDPVVESAMGDVEDLREIPVIDDLMELIFDAAGVADLDEFVADLISDVLSGIVDLVDLKQFVEDGETIIGTMETLLLGVKTAGETFPAVTNAIHAFMQTLVNEPLIGPPTGWVMREMPLLLSAAMAGGFTSITTVWDGNPAPGNVGVALAQLWAFTVTNNAGDALTDWTHGPGPATTNAIADIIEAMENMIAYLDAMAGLYNSIIDAIEA
jgi:hypothetical protein